MSIKDEAYWAQFKKKAQQKAESMALKGILQALKSLLPDEAAELINEFNNPEVFEPYLREAFMLLFKSMDIPPAEIRFVIGFNGEAARMIYAVQVINIHDRSWKQVEFPMAIFLSNILDSDKRSKTMEVARKSIIAMRCYKKNDDGSKGGVIQLANGEILKLNS